MKKIIFILATTFLIRCNSYDTEIFKPFPQNETYKGNFIKPSNYTDNELNNITADFYDKWKKNYIKKCPNGSYYVYFDRDNIINVSEGLGYGMMIVVYMAGYDKDAKEIFDGMYHFYKNHPSSINPNLMAWQQVTGCIDNPNGGNDAASDGDIDIAFALLLADNQWSSNGDINYKKEALNIISAIAKDEINHDNYSVKLGDWANNEDSLFYYATRSSDFILDHFKIFFNITKDSIWNKTIDKCFKIIDTITNNYSVETGLLPDFIINTNTHAQPAYANFLESQYDGEYYYNACRVPWRLTCDYLTSGDNRTLKIIHKINSWLYDVTEQTAENIKSGYTLSGNPIGDYVDLAFYGAFAVSFMVETDKQNFLNNTFEMTINSTIENNDYFGNTLKMLYLLVLSGNYWLPS